MGFLLARALSPHAVWPISAASPTPISTMQCAWLFKNNPLGMFAPTNPDVSCEGYDFSLLKMPTKMMPGP